MPVVLPSDFHNILSSLANTNDAGGTRLHSLVYESEEMLQYCTSLTCTKSQHPLLELISVSQQHVLGEARVQAMSKPPQRS